MKKTIVCSKCFVKGPRTPEERIDWTVFDLYVYGDPKRDRVVHSKKSPGITLCPSCMREFSKLLGLKREWREE